MLRVVLALILCDILQHRSAAVQQLLCSKYEVVVRSFESMFVLLWRVATTMHHHRDVCSVFTLNHYFYPTTSSFIPGVHSSPRVTVLLLSGGWHVVISSQAQNNDNNNVCHPRSYYICARYHRTEPQQHSSSSIAAASTRNFDSSMTYVICCGRCRLSADECVVLSTRQHNHYTQCFVRAAAINTIISF